MRTFIIRFFPILALLFTIDTFASVTPPNDGPYYRLRSGRTLYIYDARSRELIPDLADYNHAVRQLYDREFDWHLDEEQSLVLLSANTQDGNGVARQQPTLKTLWYGSAQDLLESVAASSWLKFLAVHEVAHLYQMNAKAPLSSALKKVFGDATVVNPIALPLFLLPNQVLPISFAEGNAVLNESRMNQGGRLYSGEERASVLRQVAAGRFDARRLINQEFTFPFGEANYSLGGYFAAHLASKYGVDRTNRFFRAHATHWLNPLRINATFRDHFGETFYREVREATRGLERLAERQVTTNAPWLAPALFVFPLNHDDGRIWWLANDGFQIPTLNVMDKKTRAIESRELNLPAGKVFWSGDRPLTAATYQNDLHHQTFGLYAENFVLTAAANEIVTDERAGHRAGFRAEGGWREPSVIRDGQVVGVGHSRPILDGRGRTYYFRQFGPKRLLYRDHEVLTQYEGYYGKLTEVDSAGRVDFIANTPFGSSLFRWDGHEYTRLVDSDVVVDARRLDDHHVLLSEVDANGGHVVIAEVKPRAETPAVYAYPFAQTTIQVTPTLAPTEVAREERPYSALRELRYSSASAGAEVSSLGGLGLSATAAFTDPLEFNTITAGAYSSAFGSRGASASYTYDRFLPHPFARYTYGDYRYRTTEGHRRVIEQEGDLGVNIDVLRHGIFDASVGAAAVFTRREGNAVDSRSRGEGGALLSATATRSVLSPLGFYPWRLWRTTLTHRGLFDGRSGQSSERADGLRVDWTHGFKGQRFLAATARVADADQRAINVGYEADLLPTAIGVSLLGLGPIVSVRRAGSLRVEARKVYNPRAYDHRLPVGLNRWALVGAVQSTATTATNTLVPSNIFEYGVGVDLDLLLAHQTNARARIMITHVNDDLGYPQNQVVFGAAGGF